jgi:hypothetical protein
MTVLTFFLKHLSRYVRIADMLNLSNTTPNYPTIAMFDTLTATKQNSMHSAEA